MKINELMGKINDYGLDAYIGVSNSHYISETSSSSAVILTPYKSILLCSRLDLGQAQEESVISDIRTFSRSEAPLRDNENALFGEFWEVLYSVIDELDAEKIGYDQLDCRTIRELRRNTDLDLEEASDILKDLRIKKTRKEINYIKKSAEIAIKGMERARELIEPGISEIEIAAEVEYEMRNHHSEGTSFDTLVAAGDNSWKPHITPTDKELSKGELVIIDLGARWNGYCSDMTRTFSISPNSQQEEIIEIAKNAQDRVIKQVKPGVEAKILDSIAREIIFESGYGECYLHSSGHGVGLNIHEPPSLSPFSEEFLSEEMIITVEPGLYVEGVGGARFEDMLLVTERGCEFLTR